MINVYRNNLFQIVLAVLFIALTVGGLYKWNQWTWQYIAFGILFCMLWRNVLAVFISNIAAAVVIFVLWNPLFKAQISSNTLHNVQGFAPIIILNLVLVFIVECAIVLIRNWLLRMLSSNSSNN